MKHHVVRTPIDTINILGAGGIKGGSICQPYGPPGCFTGDTVIRMLDEGKKTLEELSTRTEPFWVYSYDINQQKPVPGLATFASKHLAKDLFEITLDNGVTLKCTSDHKWLRSSLTYVEAKDLAVGDSIQAAGFSREDDLETISSTSNLTITTEEMISNALIIDAEYQSCCPLGYGLGTDHKITNIEVLSTEEMVYDLSVEGYNNFLIDLGDESGVYVHNSGKSTFCYQSAALYQRDNPDAVIHIIDVENSVDMLRLEHVFKLDMDRVRIHHLQTLEEAFKVLIDCTEQMTKQQIGSYQDGRKKIKLASKKKLSEMTDSELFTYAEQFQVITADNKREPMIKAKNYDNDRVRVIKALALAGAYTIPEYDNMIPTLAIWDTIAVSRPQAEFDKIAEGNMGKNAAGMNLSTQVISQKLSSVLGAMGGKTLTLLLPNQVRLKGFGSYGGPTESFYGSFAIEHSCHYILRFDKIKNKESRMKNYDDDIKMKTGTDFRMKIEKTKFCPATQGVELYINDQLGGIIVPGEELAFVALELGLMKKVHAGYEIVGDTEFGKLKWTREEDPVNFIANNAKVRKALLEIITRHYRKSYFTLNLLYQEVGLDLMGKPSEEDLLLRQTIEDQEILQDMSDNPFGS